MPDKIFLTLEQISAIEDANPMNWQIKQLCREIRKHYELHEEYFYSYITHLRQTKRGEMTNGAGLPITNKAA